MDRWDRIVLPAAQKDRLLNHLLFSLRHRGRVSQVGLPVHGLLVLAGPPGTGKTTLAGGLADQAARLLDGPPLLFVDIDPHSFPSQLLGESQRTVARLFERTLPDLAKRGRPMVVLLDEVEALAVSRNGASLETNPVDVHRATDAVLAGVDRVAWQCPNVTFVATTNRRLGRGRRVPVPRGRRGGDRLPGRGRHPRHPRGHPGRAGARRRSPTRPVCARSRTHAPRRTWTRARCASSCCARSAPRGSSRSIRPG